MKAEERAKAVVGYLRIATRKVSHDEIEAAVTRAIREAEQEASRKKLMEAIKIIEAEDCDQTEYLCHALYRCAEAIRALIDREGGE